MRDKLTDAMRIGKVSSIDPIKCTAQVTFEDRQNEVSGDLFIVVPFTLNDRAYYMPAIGERVRVLFDPESPSKGCILGAYYSDSRLTPHVDESKAYFNFQDETLIEYDKKQNKLTIKIIAKNETSIDIETASDINIKCNGKITVTAAEEIVIKCQKNCNIETDANVRINAKKDITVDAANNTYINVTGDTTVNTNGKTSIYSNDNMTIESSQVLTLKGKSSTITL